jgi:hypothetical protein
MYMALFSLHDVHHVCCYIVSISCSSMNDGLCMSPFVSIIWNLFFLNLYMWYFCSVFKRVHFLCVLIMSVVCYGSIFVSCV